MLITLIIQDIFLLITYQNVNIPTCLSHHSEFLNNKLVNITLFITNLPALFSEQVKPNKSNMSETLYPGNRKEPRVIVPLLSPMAESEEELKSLLMKVKEESDKAGLKLSVQKLRSWYPVPSLHGK